MWESASWIGSRWAFWIVPVIGSAICLLFLVVLFRNPTPETKKEKGTDAPRTL